MVGWNTTAESCNAWRPPPLPPIELAHVLGLQQYNDLVQFVRTDIGFNEYIDICNGTLPEPRVGTSTTTIGTPTRIHYVQTTQAASAGAGLVVGLIFLFLALIAALVIGIYLWKDNKKRTASINSLPLKRYENINYLDNKARDNQCWNSAVTSHQEDHKNSIAMNRSNTYGSLPQSTDNSKVEYVKSKHPDSSETKVESPRSFDHMNISQNAYDNETYVSDTDRDNNESRSPSANSQTPLFDTVDGSALPNVPVRNSIISENSLKSDEVMENGSVSNVDKRNPKPGGRLPPIDMTVNKTDMVRKTSGSNVKSPKKKKAVYLQRKSEPVDWLEDIAQDMSGNRKSV